MNITVPGESLDPARMCRKGVVIIYQGEELWVASMKDFLTHDTEGSDSKEG